DALYVRLPRARRDPCRPLELPAPGALAWHGSPGRLPHPVRVRVRGGTSGPGHARRARLGAARARRRRLVPEPDDGAAGHAGGRARRAGGEQDRRGGVAVELLLLSREPAAAGVSVLVLPPLAGQVDRGRPRRALPG